ncbi:hypothetical protein ABZ651_26810, partial [Streptomyces sp. NPDC007070]
MALRPRERTGRGAGARGRGGVRRLAGAEGTGQEAMHAEAHQGVLDHFQAKGLDISPYVTQ